MRLIHVSTFSLDKYLIEELLTRLRGAKIDGFEGSKMLELKINRKRLAKGEEKIDLQKECEEDLRIRRND